MHQNTKTHCPKILQFMAFHEAGHKILYGRFGGNGNAVITKKLDTKSGEVIWGGQFRVLGSLAHVHEAMRNAGMDLGIELPQNWEVLVGLAGLVAEEIFRGETNDPRVIADEIRERIMAGEASETDLDLMRIEDIDAFELSYGDVELVCQYLREDWELVEEEVGFLIEEALDGVSA
jgi:hypothetical protein